MPFSRDFKYCEGASRKENNCISVLLTAVTGSYFNEYTGHVFLRLTTFYQLA
jgi:hypothetical protein